MLNDTSVASSGVSGHIEDRDPYDLANYQSLSRRTWRWIPAGSDQVDVYCALGLADEAGEVAGKVKKVLRDSGGIVTAETKEAIKLELGDALWYLTQIATSLDLTLEEVAASNLLKLLGRLERGTIGGSGDNR